MTLPLDSPTLRLIEALRCVLDHVAEPIHVLRTILEQAVTRTEADRGIFVEVDFGGSLDYRVLHRFEVARPRAGTRGFPRPMDGPRFVWNDSTDELEPTSTLSMPIRVEGTIVALVHLERDRSGHFTEEQREILRSLLDVAAPLFESLRLGKGLPQPVHPRRSRQGLSDSRDELSREWSFERFVGGSPSARVLEETVRRVARTDLPVLIEGETGTGKSLLARILHHLGPRSNQAFVTVFCPSLEKGLVETELFGHRRGAFTGADADRIGKVQAAQGGTLFLDEVGELPREIQAKLLRLLHEKTFERLGDPQEHRADVRVLAATNNDLAAEVRSGAFRRDLYERLRFVVIEVPPLRERREDLPRLLRRALDAHEPGRWIELSDEATRWLVESDHAWRGNVREVEQLAARLALVLPGGAAVSRADIERALGRPDEPSRSRVTGLPDLVESAERALLERALRENPGLSRANLAAKLCISERSLYKKLRAFGLGR